VNLSQTLLPVLLGLGTGLSLIIAIGAQNAFVLKFSIHARIRAITAIVLVCAVSDAILISAGVLGIGELIRHLPVALAVVRIVGSGFLFVYGLVAARRVFRPKALVVTDETVAASTSAGVLTAIALTWLNPHVYLDTVIFLGSVANQQGIHERWWWAAGAIAGSFIWFSLIGFGARFLRPFFARPNSWRILDGAIAVTMIVLGIRLAVSG